MAFSNKVATIFGGTGFVGEQIVRELADHDITIKVASRTPEKAYFLRPAGVVGQIVPVAYAPNDPESVADVIKGSDYVVNCVGLLAEKGKATFKKAHVVLPELIAKACAAHKVKRFVHLSALGIETSRAKYARTKLEGEQVIRKAFPDATILRPSIIFGPDDGFFNMFASMSQFLPALPLIGGGKTKFQPVYVGDVADAAIKSITLPATGDKNPLARTYELGGPEILTFKELLQRLFAVTERKRALVPLPWGIAKLQAGFLSLLPNPPLTPDQVVSLKSDNVINDGANTLEDLDIQPTGMSLILPTYLNRFRPGGRGKIVSGQGSS